MSDDENDVSGLNHVDMSVRELLTEMKDTSEVITDLAYASLMYNSQPMADKVRGLEKDMDDLKYSIRYKVLMSCRTREDARQLSGLLEVASAADRISDAASEIVGLLNLPAERRPFISEMLSESGEKIRILRVKPQSDMIGNTIKKLAVEASTGCKIIALRNRHGWTYDPDDEQKIHAADDLIVRGTDEGADRLSQFTEGQEKWVFPDPIDEEDAEEDADDEESIEQELRGDEEE